jgi:thioredoxin-like negative regulator of GroEL
MLPSDGNLHEFRALNLFAMKKYKEAAGVLYAVLADEPGWNWDTLSSFYTNTDTYTQQLRDLESHVEANPADVPARFVLAYHYLVLEERTAALEQFREIVKQEPRDSLSASLIEALEKKKS